MERLQAGPVTVSLHAYGGFEQVGPLPWSLPASDEQIAASPGDIMLYQGDQITIFTGSNSWAYTPLGSIEDATPEMLSEVFAGDAVEITLSLAYRKLVRLAGLLGARDIDRLKGIRMEHMTRRSFMIIGAIASGAVALTGLAGCGGTSKASSAATSDFLESMADSCKAVLAAQPNMLFVNVMNNLSVDCDCDSNPAPSKMADIGILASADPVALDQACVDLVYASNERIESRDGSHVLEAAEKLGVGSRAYDLVEIGF